MYVLVGDGWLNKPLQSPGLVDTIGIWKNGSAHAVKSSVFWSAKPRLAVMEWKTFLILLIFASTLGTKLDAPPKFITTFSNFAVRLQNAIWGFIISTLTGSKSLEHISSNCPCREFWSAICNSLYTCTCSVRFNGSHTVIRNMLPSICMTSEYNACFFWSSIKSLSTISLTFQWSPLIHIGVDTLIAFVLYVCHQLILMAFLLCSLPADRMDNPPYK